MIINIKIVEFAKDRKHLTITFMDDTGQMELGVIQKKALASRIFEAINFKRKRDSHKGLNLLK